MNLVATAPASNTNNTHYSSSFNGASMTSGIGAKSGIIASRVQEVETILSATPYQYQDCTVGFCGGWGSHDRIIQVSSQSHIQYHPSSMLGTQ